MKKTVFWIAWGVLYIICVPFAYVAEPSQTQKLGMLLLSLIFFIPPGVLLGIALWKEDKKTLLRLRWISGLSLALTLCFYVANIFSALGSPSLGDTLYGFLNLVSVPMFCSGYPFLSMLLWAILLFSTIVKIPKNR